MGLRQRVWARQETFRLRELLGNCCAWCGTQEDLQFDLIKPVGDDDHHRKMEWSWRISFYRQQLAKNNLQLLCEKDNGKKGQTLDLLPF